MPITLWTSAQLARIMTDDRLNAIPSHFLDTYFGGAPFYSGTKEIMIEELPAAYRTLAPFVLPTEQGKPIWRQKQSGIRSYMPAYVKPKDTVTPGEATNINRRVLLGQSDLDLGQKFDLLVASKSEDHLRAIKTTWAWMASRSMIDGKITIKYDRDQGAAFPEVLIDFGRDAGHTVVKGANYWDNPATPILDDVETWAQTMVNAVRGGMPTRMYVGSSVAPVFKRNSQVLAQMDMTMRGNAGTDFHTGALVVDRGLTPLGSIYPGIQVFSYRDDYEDPLGNMVPVLGPKDILLVAPGFEGLKAFGAILNAKAIRANGGALSTDIFPSMWEEDDPSQLFLMHESAPLMIPLYPNRTFKATVLA